MQGQASIEEQEWWVSYPRRKDAKVMLFMFPYAGASPNTFSQWGLRMPSSVEVNVIYLPGRMGRSNLAPIRDWRVLASKIGDAIIAETAKAGQKYAIYGHSFGGLLGYLTAVHIRERGGPLPVTFMAGSKKAPWTFVQPESSEKLIHDFSKEEMRAYYMKHFAHAAPKDFLAIPGMVDSICTTLQIDLGMNQKFWWSQLSASEQRPLDAPIHAFFGENDDRNNDDDLQMWEKHTSGEFYFHHYPGNHFFIHEDQDAGEFLDDVAAALQDCAKT
jgi:medium-chain acyl-[acyl-carrier-protein] hydrolase